MDKAGAVATAAGTSVVSPTVLLEFVGCVCGVGGTLHAALLGPGDSLLPMFIAYAVSNVALIGAAIRRGALWLLVMNAAYGITTVIGLCHHFPSGP